MQTFDLAILYDNHNLFTWMFDHVLLKFSPGVFMHLAISVRAAVTYRKPNKAS